MTERRGGARHWLRFDKTAGIPLAAAAAAARQWLRFDKDGRTVWKFGGDDAPADKKLKWPSGFVRMADGTTYVSEAQGRDIKVISPDKKVLRVITSPAMAHPCTLVVVDE